MTNQFIKKFYDPGGGTGAGDSGGGGGTGSSGTAGLIAGGAGGLQMILGIVQAITGSAKAKKYEQMLRPYETPDEVYAVLNATKNLASGGYDPFTLNYLTSNVDQAFASSAGVAKRLGADANMLSNLFNERVKGMMKIGAENHALNLENFSKYLAALDTVAANKAAEQKSKQDIIKDKIQAAVADKQAGLANIGGGINSIISAASTAASGGLFV